MRFFFISAKISLVNMIQDVSIKLGNINVDVVTDALKHSTQRIMGPKYMTAGMGDGGACHPRDNIALRFLAKKLNLGYDLFDAIMDSREKQAKNMAKYLVNLSKKHKLNICIHGKAYKPDVPYLDGSLSISRASRTFPQYLIFKPSMIITGILLFYYCCLLYTSPSPRD